MGKKEYDVCAATDTIVTCKFCVIPGIILKAQKIVLKLERHFFQYLIYTLRKNGQQLISSVKTERCLLGTFLSLKKRITVCQTLQTTLMVS